MENKEALRLYQKEGLTYREVGKKFNMSGQAIHQRLKPMMNKAITEEHHKVRNRNKFLARVKPCKICKKSFTSNNKKQKYCSSYCAGVPKQTKWPGGEKNPYPRQTVEGCKWRYQMMLKYFPEKLYGYMLTAVDVRNNDPKALAHYNKYQKEYAAKKYKKLMKELKKDPVKLAAYRKDNATYAREHNKKRGA